MTVNSVVYVVYGAFSRLASMRLLPLAHELEAEHEGERVAAVVQLHVLVVSPLTEVVALLAERSRPR